MPIDSDLNKILLVKGLPTCEDLEDLFMDMADDKAKLEASFRLVVDTNIVTEIDIRHVMFVFDWFLDNYMLIPNTWLARTYSIPPWEIKHLPGEI
jgi:hypothetical protein